jgi:hypothetical protein
MGIEDKDFNVMDYLEKIQKQTVDNIIELSNTGTEKDSVRLKANQVILNKLVPDRTKMDLDIKNNAPYDVLLKSLEKGGSDAA